MNTIDELRSNLQAVKVALRQVEDTLDTGFELKHREAVLDFEAETRILLGRLKANFHDAIKPITEEDIKTCMAEIEENY